MYRLFLAFHYLLKHRIMWVSVVGVAIGLASVILVDSIFNGFVQEVLRIQKGVQSDVMIRLPSGGPDSEALAERLRRVEGVAGVSRRVFRPCLFPTDEKLPQVLAFGQMSRGSVMQVVGVVPGQEASVSEFRRFLDAVEDSVTESEDGTKRTRRVRVPELSEPFDVSDLGGGSAFGRSALPPILLGDQLARHLKLQRGDTIQLVTFPANEELDDSETVTGRFVIAGTFRTGKFDLDLGTAFLRYQDLCAFAGLPPDAHELAVKAEEDVDVDELAARLRAALPTLRPSAVETWRERTGYFEGAIENQRQILNAILFILVFVASFTLLITLCMTVTEKRRDLGILASMGGTRMGVSAIFTSCGLLVGLVGSAVGLMGGLLLSWRVDRIHDWLGDTFGIEIFTEEVYGLSQVPSAVDPPVVGLFVLGACVMTLVFSLVPTWVAGSMPPVDALRRN